jgi:uncharacterized protein
MKVDIGNVLKNENTSLDIAYSLDMSDVEFYGEYPLKTPLDIAGKVVNTAGMVELLLRITGNIDTQCARCLKELKVSVDLSLRNYLVTELSNPEEGNDEMIVVESNQLDLDDIVRTSVILNIAQKNLCKEDCKGLCPVCGRDLNEGTCGCVTKTVDPRLAVLKDYFK